VQPLRVGLTTDGWHTLSIQMPILPNEAKMEEYAPLFEEVEPRIKAAIDHLTSNGVNNIVLVAHSLGSAMGAYYLTKPDPGVTAYVGIGMSASATDNRMNQAHTLSSVTLPVLDLYGSEDLEDVVKNAPKRLAAAKKAGNKHYTQIKTPGANHFYDGKDAELLSTVKKWLNEQK